MDKAHPNRNRRAAMEGICGDAAHRKRKSDHNPAKCGCCHARDLTYDSRYMTDAWCRRVAHDRRVKYVILKRRLYSGVFPNGRAYYGSNPHTDHAHVSLADSHALHSNVSPFPIATGPTVYRFRYVVVRATVPLVNKVALYARRLVCAYKSMPGVGGGVLVVHARPSKAAWLVNYAHKIGATNVVVVPTNQRPADMAAYLSTLR
jgi:hypothetical protein